MCPPGLIGSSHHSAVLKAFAVGLGQFHMHASSMVSLRLHTQKTFSPVLLSDFLCTVAPRPFPGSSARKLGF